MEIGQLDKNYNPQELEPRVYENWEKNGLFKPSGNGPCFSIVLPPPNVTGVLHIGHALDHTLQDIMVRQKRMAGYNTLWLPGTDHAGIATQNVVEKALKAEGKTRHDLGRDAFLDKVWEWKHQYGNVITQQMRKLGDSVDWSRERFTMDEGCQHAVAKAFVTLYEQGYIYKGYKIINWCPVDKTALSDIEVEHQDYNGHIWSIRYDGEEGSVVVATTRPETLFGDTAIAVHPEDARYANLIGKTVRVPYTERNIPIIADEHVDPAFGTGAVKVTPAHDPNDFEIGQRHNLPNLIVLDESAHTNENVPERFRNLDRYDCRKQLVKALEEDGQLIEVKEHAMSRGHSQRSGAVVEPYLSNQWFVDMKKVVQPAIDSVRDGRTKIIPQRWEKLYFEWMENIRDWCISRQIWWGHRIPVWYKKDDPNQIPIVTLTPPEGDDYIQDSDVLDTWFSSGLWPFSTMGWPENTQDLATFYPTNFLVTGYDILTFWVSRMMTMGHALTNTQPFSEVYIHGLVRDMTGKKMSKSLGNVVNPLDMIEKYGADALRFSLASLSTLGGQDIKFSEEKVESSRNFANKIWNAARFIFMILEEQGEKIDLSAPIKDDQLATQWIWSHLNTTLIQLNKDVDTFNYAQATERLWEFTWNNYCDWYIEISKLTKKESLPSLLALLVIILKINHPFMPFVTEEIYQRLCAHPLIECGEPNLITASWPTVNTADINPEIEADMDYIIKVIREVRHLRTKLNVSPAKSINLIIMTDDPQEKQAILATQSYLERLAKVDQLTLLDTTQERPTECSSSVVQKAELFIPLKGLIDIDKEKARLEKKIETISQDLMGLEQRLQNKNFIEKAPKDIIDKIKTQAEQLITEKDLLLSQMELLN